MTGSIGAGAFIAGLLLLAVTIAAASLTAAIVVRRCFAHLEGAARLVAFLMIALLGMLVTHVVPLMLGVLSRGTVLVAAILLVALARALTGPLPRPALRSAALPAMPSERGLQISYALGALAILVTAAYALAYVQSVAGSRLTGVDALGFHLPDAIRFLQSGSLWQTIQYVPGQAQGNYPQYGDVMFLVATLPWHSLLLVRYVDPLLLLCASIAVYGVARELGAQWPAAALSACLLPAIGAAGVPAFADGMTDPLFLVGFAGGLLFLMRHWRTRANSDLVLAGIGFGLALGAKWYALTDIPALLVPWGAAWLIARRPWRELLRSAAIVIGVLLLAGGIWLLRNWVLTGDPVFNYKVTLFGVTIFDAPPDSIRRTLGFTLAHYAGKPSILRHYVWPVFRTDFGLPGAIAALAVPGALIAWALRRRSEAGESASLSLRAPVLAGAAVLLAIAYSVTPYSALGLDGAPVLVSSNTRYGVPALLVGLTLAAWLSTRVAARARPVLEAVMLIAAIVGLRHDLSVHATRVAVVLVALAVLAAAGIRFGIPLLRRLDPVRALAGVAGAVAVLLLALAGGAYHYQRSQAAQPWSPADAAVDYVLIHYPAGAHIALTGSWNTGGIIPVAPLFGPKLNNHVNYVGPFVRHLLSQYGDQGSFVAALKRGGYQALLIGTGSGAHPNPHPPAELWAASAGYIPVASSSRFIAMINPPS